MSGLPNGRSTARVAPDPDRAFAAAYASTLASSLVAAGLTYLYVGPAARELNPVTAGLIATLGPAGMVAVRVLVVIGAFWGYHHLRGRWPVLTVAVAWVASLVHVLDAVHDVRVAAAAAAVGFVPVGDLGSCLLVVSVSLFAGVVLRPPASRAATDGATWPTLGTPG